MVLSSLVRMRPTRLLARLGFFTDELLQFAPMSIAPMSIENTCKTASLPRLARGFTMVELVAVIVVVGILAAFALPRFVQNEVLDARAFTDQNLNMLRYAQKLAIAQNRPVFVLMTSSRIALCFSAACEAPNRVLAPAGSNTGSSATLAQCGTDRSWFCEGKPAKIAYGVPQECISFYFNALGRPFLATDIDPSSTFGKCTIAIGSSPVRNVIVEAETGYVHL